MLRRYSGYTMSSLLAESVYLLRVIWTAAEQANQQREAHDVGE